MTNEEAINLLGGLAKKIDEYYGLNGEGRTAFDMAISALKAQDLHNTCTEVAQDTVSRQAAIDVAVNYHLAHDITHIPNTQWDDGFKTGWNLRENDIIHGLEELPSAEPEIIRCRDCKHWDKTWSNNWSPDYHYCPVIDEVRKGNFHCRYAERRKDG